MPKTPKGTEDCTGMLRDNPKAQRFILANYRTMALLDLCKATKVRYATVSQFLYKRGLMANRHTIKRYNIRAALKLSKTEAAYLAGIVDGEGTISVRSQGRYTQPLVTISNTDWSLLQWLTARGFYGTLSKNGNGRLYWRMHWSGYQTADVLRLILPFLVTKRRHADLTLELISNRAAQRYKAAPTARMRAIVAEIRALNVRGSRLADSLKRAGLSTTSFPKNTLSLLKDS